MKVSVLIITYNEASNLPRCLGALAWCDDVVVLDSGSTDRTVEIARAYGARILSRPFDTFAGQRNFGLDAGEFRHEWVLHLDADEVVTPELASALADLVPAPGIDAYRLPSKLILYDRWLRRSGMYPTYQVRLGHRDRLRFEQVGHGQREALASERVGVLDEPYLHYNFSHGLAAWLRRHVKYADDEATVVARIRRGEAATSDGASGGDPTSRRRALKSLANRLPLLVRPVARFCYILIWRRGILDGRLGVLYALMLSVYEGMIAVLTAEKLGEPANPVTASQHDSCARMD